MIKLALEIANCMPENLADEIASCSTTLKGVEIDPNLVILAVEDLDFDWDWNFNAEEDVQSQSPA